MAKKGWKFSLRKNGEKEYYEFPLWFRIVRGVFLTLWTALKVALGAGVVAAAMLFFTGVLFATMLGDYLQKDVIPNADFNVESFNLDQSSFIYYVDSEQNIQLMQQIYAETDRTWASYEEIPQDLIHAAVAIEDKRFYEHQGVDWFTTTKACINMFLGGSSTFGGSTITQQLIKNLTQEDDVTVRRKILEIFNALQFEERYTKEEVMEWYLNTIYLGHGRAGVKSAAKVYFGKNVSDLTTAECASLISITNNPSLYDPYTDEENNRKRQLIVLSEMLNQGYLDQAAYEEAVAQEMVFTSVPVDDEVYTCPECGFTGTENKFQQNEEGGYTCPQCDSQVPIEKEERNPYYSYFTDQVIRDVVSDLEEQTGYPYDVCLQMVKTGGYHIYATIDMDVQKQVDEIYADLENIPTTASTQQLQSAIVVVDNRTGDVVAMAGGVGEKTGYLTWNRATQSTLQAGSCIKPLTVYGPALELGAISPATAVFDGPLYRTSSGNLYPLNESRSYSGMTTVLRGVSSSLNTVAVRVLDTIGAEYSFDFAKNQFGLSTLVDHVTINGSEKTDIDYSPLALGALTYGVTVRDMTSAYATYANNGVWREGRTYSRVYDSDGNIVLDNVQQTRTVLSRRTVTYMNYMLQYAVNYGTGTPAQISGMNVAGKTGTTSNNSDRWFGGYTPYYTAVVWCGYDQPEQVVLTGTKTNPAVRLWKAVMAPLHEGLENRDLYDGSGLVAVSICSESGKAATDACRADPRGSCAKTVYVLPEDRPDGYCDLHVMVEYCEAGKAMANSYCAQIFDNVVTKKGLVKMSDALKESYEMAGLSYEEFYYSESEKNRTTCTLHTKQMVDDQNKPPEPPPVEPPTVPTQPPVPD